MPINVAQSGTPQTVGDASARETMIIEDLETFVEILDAAGISDAARRLGVSKSIVSRRLARLEAELGIQLLVRNTRGAIPTDFGLAFRDHAARAVAELSLARETLLPAGDLRGRLRIAAPLTFGPSQLAPFLAEFARSHPRLHVHASYTDRFVDLVGEGFDCAIRVGHLGDSSLIARRIGPIQGKLVASPDYVRLHGAPEAPHELIDHEALMQGIETWPFQGDSQPIIVHPQGRFKADNGTALLAAAVAGLGIALLPDFLTDDYIASGALVRVMTDYSLPDAGIFVLRPLGQHPARKVRLLIDFLVEKFG